MPARGRVEGARLRPLRASLAPLPFNSRQSSHSSRAPRRLFWCARWKCESRGVKGLPAVAGLERSQSLFQIIHELSLVMSLA